LIKYWIGCWITEDYYEKQLRRYGYKFIIWKGKEEEDNLIREDFKMGDLW
jgi:hypothetical protein